MNNLLTLIGVIAFSQLIIFVFAFFRPIELFLQLKKFLLWLPFQISLNFVLLYLTGIFSSQTNQAPIAVLSTVCAIACLFLTFVIEFSPITRYDKVAVKELGTKRNWKMITFTALSVISVLPFVLYFRFDYFQAVVIFTLIFLYAIALNFCPRRVKELLERKIFEIYISCADHDSSAKNPFSLSIEEIPRLTHEDSIKWMQQLQKAEKCVRRSFVGKNFHERMSLFSDFNVSTSYIHETADYVLEKLLTQLMFCQHSITAAFDTDSNRRAESQAALANMSSPENLQLRKEFKRQFQQR